MPVSWSNHPALARYFEAVADQSGEPKTAANWILGPVKSWLNENHARMDDFPLSPEKLATLIILANRGKGQLYGCPAEDIPGTDPAAGC